MILEEFAPIAATIAASLKERGEKIAVIDGATGGLVSASLLTVPGALAFYLGGGVLYSLRARDILLGVQGDGFRGMRSATEEYALAQARAVRDQFGAHWGFAETGSAGSSRHPMGVESGRSCAAIVGPGVERVRVTETGSDDRMANMETFTRAGLELVRDVLAGA